MTINDTKIVKAHFRGDKKFGRTMQLVEKATGRVLFEGMGWDWTKMELFSGYINQLKVIAKLAADFAAAAGS